MSECAWARCADYKAPSFDTPTEDYAILGGARLQVVHGGDEMRPLKVTLVEFSPSGGLFQFALQLGQGVAELGHHVELVTGRDPEFQPAVSGMRIVPILPTWHPGAARLESRLLHKARRPVRALRYVEAWRRLMRHLDHTQPDVVQWSDLRHMIDGWLIPRLASQSSGPAMVDLAHGPEPMVPRGGAGSMAAQPHLRRALAEAYRCMDAVFVLGERSRRQLLEAWPEVRRVDVIPHGDEHVFARDGLPPPDRCPPRVLLFGSLTWYKGVDLLLDAFSVVRNRIAEAELVVAGAVSADLDFAAVARRSSAVGGVTLLPGYVPADRVPDLFGGARVVVAPYRLANQSGVVHLAYTFGRPVVATNVGDLSEAVAHEVTGLLVPADDPTVLAAALVRLLDDPQEAARLGGAGARRLSQRASWNDVARQVVAVYQELVKEERSAGSAESSGRGAPGDLRAGNVSTAGRPRPPAAVAGVAVVGRGTRRLGVRPGGMSDGENLPCARNSASYLQVRRLAFTDSQVGTAWRRLQDEGGVRSPFLAWQWISAIVDVPEEFAGAEVIAVNSGRHVVGLLPILPLVGPGGLRTLGLAPRWLGADHLDLVAEAQCRDIAARAVADHLASRRDWEMLDLDGLDPSGSLVPQLRRHLRPPRFLPLPAVPVPAPYVRLEKSSRWWTSNAMKEAARKVRGAERTGGGFSVVKDPDEVAELVEELMELHNRRMGKRSEVFATAARRRFHLLAARRMADAGMARIYRLVAGGVNAGLQYDLVLGERIFFYQSGIVPEAGRSPGLTVVGQAIRSAADEGFKEFDLLRGDEFYKHRFATDTRQDTRLLVLRVTPRVAVYGGGWVFRKTARRLSRLVRTRTVGRGRP